MPDQGTSRKWTPTTTPDKVLDIFLLFLRSFFLFFYFLKKFKSSITPLIFTFITYYLQKKKDPIFLKANFIYIFFIIFVTLFFFSFFHFFFFFSLTSYFWNSKLYCRFLIFAFWYLLSILYLFFKIIFVTFFLFFFFFSLTLYFWNSKLYSRFLIFAFLCCYC